MQFRYNPRCLFTALQIVEDRKKAQAGKKFAKKAGFFSSCQDFGKGWTNASTISRFWMDSEAKTKKLEERAKALAILRAVSASKKPRNIPFHWLRAGEARLLRANCTMAQPKENWGQEHRWAGLIGLAVAFFAHCLPAHVWIPRIWKTYFHVSREERNLKGALGRRESGFFVCISLLSMHLRQL